MGGNGGDAALHVRFVSDLHGKRQELRVAISAADGRAQFFDITRGRRHAVSGGEQFFDGGKAEATGRAGD